MYNCYVTSSYTIRCKASPSFSFNDYCTSCLNERFYKNPISYYSTSLCCNCCNCGRNVVHNNGGFLYPTYLNGLKQSTLIHCAPRKRVILNGFDRFYGSRFTDYDVGRSSYGEYYERKVRGSRLKLGSGRLSSVFSEEESEGRQSHCGGREGFDEVETMIGLLSEDVTDEYVGVVERRGKAIKKSYAHGGGTYGGKSASEIELETRRIKLREDNLRREALLGRESRKVKVKEEKKKIDDGVTEDASKFEYESKTMRSRKGSMRKKEDEKREVSSGREFQKTRVKEERGNQLRGKLRAKHVEEETEYLLGENQRARVRKSESENLSRLEDELWKARKSRAKHVEEETEHLIGENQRARVRKAESENLSRNENELQKARKSRAKHVEEETEHLLGENHRARVRKDESENLSRHEDKFRKARKDMSSCSSYYSISSGEFESDEEMQVEQHDIDTGFNIGFQRDSKATHDDKQEFKRHEKYSKESGLVLQKDDSDTRLSGASVGVESSWRKESEKKLTDASVKEAEYIKDSPIKKSRYREHQESSEIDSGSHSFDHRSEKVSSVVSETTIERNRQNSEAETRMKYKHFKDTSEAFGADYEKSSSSQKVYSNRDEKLSNHASSAQDVKKHHMTADQIRWEQLSNDEESKVPEIDARGVSSNYRQSETRMKNLDDHSTINFNDRNKQRQQVVLSNKQVESRIRHERLIDDSCSESISVSREEVDRRSRKQEEKSSFMYSSRLESAESQLEANSKHVKSRIVQSAKPPQESTKMSAPVHLEAHISIASSSSQPEAKGSLHVKSPGRLVIEEITAEKSNDTIPALDEQSLDVVYLPQASPLKKVHTTKKNEAGWQPLKPISHQDALGSGDQLQKSSEHHIDNFFEKVKNEASSSEIHKLNESQKQNLESQYRQHNQATLGSGVSEPKETVSKRSSRSSRSKGPSDEMWHVNEPSVKGPSEEEALVREGTSQNAVVKRSGKSLWNLIADIVHLRWPRHEDHGGSSKSGRETSPIQSTPSETFISGHDTEESNESPVQKDKISSTKGSVSLELPKEVEISSTRGEPFHSSSLQAEEEQKGDSFPASLVSLPKESSSNGSMLSSSESSLDASLTASNPKAEGSQLLHPLPSLQIRHAPAVDQILSAELSASESAGQTSQPVSTGSSDDISHEGKDRTVKQRKLQRTVQGVKDRFGDWEEAYRLESEQQKIDELFMREALVEAKKAADIWEVPVGAVLVQGGKIIARGYNLVEELRDSTAHAEMICIREASNILRSWRLSETTLYVTLEPCPMCAGAILQARVDTVVWGAPNKLLGADGSWIRLFPNGEGASGSETTDLPAAPVHPFHPKLVIRRGVLASECANAMQQFFQRRRKKKEKEEKKPERTGPPSCLPISKHPTKFLTKMHDAFHLLFCL